jgi:hypothetical protein
MRGSPGREQRRMSRRSKRSRWTTTRASLGKGGRRANSKEWARARHRDHADRSEKAGFPFVNLDDALRKGAHTFTIFFVFFILHTAALWPWHTCCSSPPGRDQLMRLPHYPNVPLKQRKQENKHQPGLYSAPSPWNHPLFSPVPAPALSSFSRAPPPFHPHQLSPCSFPPDLPPLAVLLPAFHPRS